jgi:hypothetical protein
MFLELFDADYTFQVENKYLKIVWRETNRDATQGAARAMRTHLAKYVANVLHLQPATFEAIAYPALLHGPVGYQA